MELAETIKNSVLEIRSKVLPTQAPSVTPFGAEGDVIQLHSVYEFLGLDFANRTGRENQAINKKIQALIEYAKMTDGDVIGALRELQAKAGSAPTGMNLLDHLYHQVRYMNEASQTDTVQERVSAYGGLRDELTKKMDGIKADIQQKLAEAKEAKEVVKLSQQMERYESRRKAIQDKIDTLTPALPKPAPDVQG